MNILVCVKEVSDPDAPPEEFTIDASSRTLVGSKRVGRVLNPFDVQAVEAALRIKDGTGAKVTVLNMGCSQDMVAAREPLTMGADELVLLDDEAFVAGDSWATASALARAVKKVGDVHLILCGRQSADWNAGQVGPGLAEILEIPCVTMARKVEVEGERVLVERVTNDGYDVVEASLPCLVTVTSELGLPRYPSIKGIREAEKIEPVTWKPADLGLDPAGDAGGGGKLRVLELYHEVQEGECEFIEGESAEDAAINLALRLRSEKMI